LGGQLLFCELQVGEHRGYGIARAPAQPPARGNPLSQLDFHTAMAFQLAPERLHRPIRQILPRGFGGERRVSANRQRNSRPLRSSKPEFIVRSEERRVGKEWRSRWGRGQYKTIHKRRTSEVYTCAGK